MVRKAVDIVLIPPEDIMDFCIKLNQEGRPQGTLNKVNAIPHITLFMGVMDDERAIIEKLKEIAASTSPIPIELKEIVQEVRPTFTSSVMNLSKTLELRALHDRIVEEIGPLLERDATKDHFLMNNDMIWANPGAEWVCDFPDKGCHDQFNPHISLVCEEAKTDQLPLRGKASTLVLAHLGSRCTCAKILFSTTFK
ncbi:MAG: 2'-5' RNA ligase family protein [Nanoarchaeota archaeon]